MRRWIPIGALALAVAAGAWLLLLRETTVETRVTAVQPTSVIGSGEDAIGVSASGALLTWQPAPKDGTLPRLPLAEPPEKGVLGGAVLQQARVLGAAPRSLLACIESSYFGESGVDVVLRSGIELRFGDASRAPQKWAAAATILADSSITALDYVDLHSPGRPAYWGSGHTLPSAEEASGSGCGG